MSNQASLEKMLEILLLISGNLRYSIKDIAEKFSITERTAYRYVDTFKSAGLVISSHEGYIQVDKLNSDFKRISDLLHFSEEEAYILSKAIHAIDDTHIIKSNLVKKLYALYDFDRVANTIVKQEHSKNVHRLLQAIKEKKQVSLINYQSAHSGIIANRLLEPFDFTTNYISVWCFEPQTKENKLFKTARIGEVQVLEQNWQHESLHNAGFIDVFRISSTEKIPVRLELSLRAKNLLEEEYPLSEQFIKKLQDLWVYDGFVCNFEGVSRFVLGLCSEVKIIEPAELKQFINERLKTATF